MGSFNPSQTNSIISDSVCIAIIVSEGVADF